jgi:hypothetical protein
MINNYLDKTENGAIFILFNNKVMPLSNLDPSKKYNLKILYDKGEGKREIHLEGDFNLESLSIELHGLVERRKYTQEYEVSLSKSSAKNL